MELMQISIKAARVNAGLTQKDAAERLGVTPLSLNRWENGKVIPNFAIVRKMAELYEIPLDNLYLSDN